MTRDSIDKRRPERTLVSLAASLLLHAIGAYFLFSLATSSSEQAAPESFTSGAVVTVTREAPQPQTPVRVVAAHVPIPHATVVPNARAAARPQSAAPHPRILHELSKFAPTAPPNPTPAPVSTMPPIPAPTAPAQIAVSAAPIAAAVPTSVPLTTTAVSLKVPPTAAPLPKPTAAPTAAPTRQPAQPTAAPKAQPATPMPKASAPQPSSSPAIVAASPHPVATQGAQTQVHVTQSQHTGLAPSPGPSSPGSPGPRAVAAVKGPQVARPIQAPPATPRPAPVAAAGRPGAHSLNRRLQALIPTGAPSASPAPPVHHHFNGDLTLAPPPPPTPPPDVLAATKFLFQENVGTQRWKQSILGTAPEELAVVMYVTSVKRIGPIKWCTGWVARMPDPGSRAGYQVDSDRDLTPKWIVEPNSSFICEGHLEPFTPPTPEPPKGS